jgi:hypothetical protein
MTSGQKAGWTTKFRKDGGIVPVKSGKADKSGQTAAANANSIIGGTRAAGCSVIFWIKCDTDKITFSFEAVNQDDKRWDKGLAQGEYALPNLRWEAIPGQDEDGEPIVVGFEACHIWLLSATTAQLERALPIMRQLDGLISRARDDSEDYSLGLVASTLAAHLRVDSVRVRDPEGMEKLHKRGAAYVTALRAGDALLERHKAAEPEILPIAAE